MRTLSGSARIVRLARDLGLSTRGDCAAAIRQFAHDQVRKLLLVYPVSTLDDLLDLVAARLSVHVETIRSDDELLSLIDRYAGYRQDLGHVLRMEFLEGDTEGLLLRHPRPDPGDRQYIALIDARGPRSSRAYFTTWHELVHLLLCPQQMAIPGFRRTPAKSEIQKDPVESLVDQVGGLLAFYEPLFGPPLEAAVARHEGPTLGAIEEARAEAAPDASFLATAIGTMRLLSEPACFVEVDMALKPTEVRRMRSRQRSLPLGLPRRTPEPKLRVVNAVRSGRVKENPVRIFNHMRVPPASMLARAYQEPGEVEFDSHEDQSWWETSSKGPLPRLPVWVQATRRGSYVYGLIVPVP